MKVIRNLKGTDIELHLTDDQVIRTPTERQRVWMVNRAVDELTEALARADVEAETLVKGGERPHPGEGAWEMREASTRGGTLEIAGQQVMQTWEAPLMERMVQRVSEGRGHVLELGFGLGISARMIDARCDAHTIIELNRDVARAAREWAAEATTPTSVLEGSWKDVLPRLGAFDGIFMDTFPADDSEYERTVLRDANWAAEVFPMAAGHLSKNGRLVYYTNEVDSLSRRHQRALLRSFPRFQVEVVEGLEPPDDCAYWWHSTMAVVTAYA
jgi:guanidinoacetate N-methyltransferase